MKACPKCKETYPDRLKFCTKCGFELEPYGTKEPETPKVAPKMAKVEKAEKIEMKTKPPVNIALILGGVILISLGVILPLFFISAPSKYIAAPPVTPEEKYVGSSVSTIDFTGEGGTQDAGVVTYSDAPRTWIVNLPDNFVKVEVAHYDKNAPDTIKKYMGWNGYLEVNSMRLWEFLSWSSDTGGLIYDYALYEEVYESSGSGLWIDATDFFYSGVNTVTYYHYTSGDGIGLKIRVTV